MIGMTIEKYQANFQEVLAASIADLGLLEGDLSLLAFGMELRKGEVDPLPVVLIGNLESRTTERAVYALPPEADWERVRRIAMRVDGHPPRIYVLANRDLLAASELVEIVLPDEPLGEN